MRDYYGLAGVFASIRPADRTMLTPEEDAAVRKARGRVEELEQQITGLKSAKEPEKVKRAEELKREVETIRKETPHFETPLVVAIEESSLHVMADGPHKTKLVYKPGEALDVPMQMRGNPATLGAVVPRHFPAVLSPGEPRTFTKGSGRLELAEAIVGEAASLSARVIVNRVWTHHFGRGLVETPSDFGAQGERPSHPELLDDLAARFIANGWSLKWLHREIMLSAAYRQSSAIDKAKQSLDPENRLLWRMNPRRLDAEAWRDAILSASGKLDDTVGGASQELGDAKNTRRTIYGTVKRRELSDFLRLHDFPDPTTHASHRVPTVTPLQQLFTLNSPFMQQQAEALARAVERSEERR
ncbi:MAG: DUF1553 domain-containing protein [Gemmataceae bacterium]